MTRHITVLLIGVTLGFAALRVPAGAQGRTSAPAQTAPAGATAAGPVLLLESAKGAMEITLYPADAPKSVEHILSLVRRHFYRGLRFHRVTNSLIQIGDPQTRNMSLEGAWGTLGSEDPIGVAEISKTRKHERGTVGLAHAGDPKYADSQIYIMKAASPSLDGKYTIIGHVTKGIEVVDKFVKADIVTDITLKTAAK